jgi:hypothetical protein
MKTIIGEATAHSCRLASRVRKIGVFRDYIWKLQKKSVYLHIENNIINNMLGIDTPHNPVKGKFAEEIRETVRRVSTGCLNEADKSRLRRSRKVLQKYDAVWE